MVPRLLRLEAQYKVLVMAAITAFAKWFYGEFNSDPAAGANYLANLAFNSSGGVAWEYLEKTGDKNYTPETFLKAANIVLAEMNDII